jgi:hypothetical protein
VASPEGHRIDYVRDGNRQDELTKAPQAMRCSFRVDLALCPRANLWESDPPREAWTSPHERSNELTIACIRE